MFRRCYVLGLGVALVWSLGCGSDPKGAAPAAAVKGTVNMDGKPVPVGEIHFGVAGAPSRMLYINNGNFAGEAPLGNNNVEVYIYSEGPPSEKYGGERQKTNVVPQKYWGPKSALKATVTAGAPNDFKFDITSK